jgi:two-component system copper resistance phosphate regulon response regulator CusR
LADDSNCQSEIAARDLRMKVLVVEAECQPAEHIPEILRNSGYTIEVAREEREMLRLAKERLPGAVILALNLPEWDQLRIIRDFREKHVGTPIILVTAHGKDTGIRGLDAGADDYLLRPLCGKELLARLRVLFRRHQPQGPLLLRVGALEMDRRKRIVTQNKQRVELTNREFALLEVLMLATPEAVSKPMLIERVWHGELSQYTNVVNVIINRLRNKISVPEASPLLHTVRGVGYALRTKSQ